MAEEDVREEEEDFFSTLPGAPKREPEDTGVSEGFFDTLPGADQAATPDTPSLPAPPLPVAEVEPAEPEPQPEEPAPQLPQNTVPERPDSVWTSEANPVWVEDWGDWAWTYEAPDDAPNAGAQYTWDSRGNVVGTPERIREAQSVQRRERRIENRPTWWDEEEEEKALQYVNEVATTRNVPLTNEDGSSRDLTELSTDVYKSFLTSERDLAAFNNKMQRAVATGRPPDLTEADERVQDELIQAFAFLDRVFPSPTTASARRQVEGRRNLTLADDLTALVRQVSSDDQRQQAVERFNEQQARKNVSRRQAEELINEIHYGITDEPTTAQRIARGVLGTGNAIRGIRQEGILPVAADEDEAAQQVTDEYVSAYDAHIKRQASSNRISQLTAEQSTSTPYVVDIGEEARGVLSRFTDRWNQARSIAFRSPEQGGTGTYGLNDPDVATPVSNELLKDLTGEQQAYFSRYFSPIISDVASVAIVREIAERGEVATPARIAAFAERYTRSTSDLSLLVAKHVPVEEQLRIAQFSAPSAYDASREVEEDLPSAEDMSDGQVLSLLTANEAYYRMEDLPNEMKDATIDSRIAWVSFRRAMDSSLTDSEVYEMFKETPDGARAIERLHSRIVGFRRMQEYEENRAQSSEQEERAEPLPFQDSIASNERVRSEYNRELDVFRNEARKFLKRTGQQVSKHRVDAIAWGMMSETIPRSLQTLTSIAQIEPVEAQPNVDFTPDMNSQETRDLLSPMVRVNPELAAEANAVATTKLQRYGTMFQTSNTVTEGEVLSPFAPQATDDDVANFNEKYGDLLPFPVRKEYTQQSIAEATGIEGYYLRKALGELHSSGIGLIPAVVYERALHHYEQDPGQTAYQAEAQAQVESMSHLARRERMRDMREAADQVPIEWLSLGGGEKMVDTPDFYRRLLEVVHHKTPYSVWKEDNAIPGATEDQLFELYKKETAFEAQSLLADHILASQGTVFYMPFSDRTIADMAKENIPDWASPLRILYASLVPVINTNDASDPGWATGGRGLTYGDLKQDNFLFQVFNILPSNYLAVGARYGWSEALNPSDDALADVASGLNLITGFGDTENFFTSAFKGVGLPQGMAEEAAFWTSLAATGLITFKEPDAVIGALAGVRSIAGVRNAGKATLRSGEQVAGHLSRYSDASRAATGMNEKQAALGELVEALGREGAGVQLQWYQRAGQALAKIWGDNLTDLDGVAGLGTQSPIIQQIRRISQERAEQEAKRDSLLRQTITDADSLTPEQLDALRRDARAADLLAKAAEVDAAVIDMAILNKRQDQLRALLAKEDVTQQILNDGLDILGVNYRGEEGLEQLIADVKQLTARVEIQQANVSQALSEIVPTSTQWRTRPRQAHMVYREGLTQEGQSVVRGVGEMEYPTRVIAGQEIIERPFSISRARARTGAPGILRPTHDSLSNVTFRLRSARKIRVELAEELEALKRKAVLSSDEAERTRAQLDAYIASSVDPGRKAIFRNEANRIRREHRSRIQELFDEADEFSPESAQAQIAEYRRYYVEYRKLVETFAEQSAETRRVLSDMANARADLRELQKELVELGRESQRLARDGSRKYFAAASEQDRAWVETLLQQRAKLDEDARTLAKLNRLYGELSDLETVKGRYLAALDARNAAAKLLDDTDLFRLANERSNQLSAEIKEALDTWNNTEFLPIAYKALEDEAAEFAQKITGAIKLAKSQFAERVASVAGRMSSELEELVVEIPNDALRKHVQDVKDKIYQILPEAEAEAVWNVSFLLPAKAFARNTGRPWEEWLQINLKGVQEIEELTLEGRQALRDARDVDGNESTRILLQTAEQGDAPIFYSQLQDVLIPELYRNRQSVPVGELRARLYKINADLSITPKSIKVAGKQQSASADEFMWTGFRNHLDGLEAQFGPRYKVTRESVDQYLNDYGVKLDFVTDSGGQYGSALMYRMAGGDATNGKTFHIYYGNRNAGGPIDVRPSRRPAIFHSHFSGDEDHIGWGRTSERNIYVPTEIVRSAEGDGMFRVLQIDEIQSDWMQAIQRQGMTVPDIRAFYPAIKAGLDAMDPTVPVATSLDVLTGLSARYPRSVIGDLAAKMKTALLEGNRVTGTSDLSAAAAAKQREQQVIDKLMSLMADVYRQDKLPPALVGFRFKTRGDDTRVSIMYATDQAQAAAGGARVLDTGFTNVVLRQNPQALDALRRMIEVQRPSALVDMPSGDLEELYFSMSDIAEMIGRLETPVAARPPSPSRVMEILDEGAGEAGETTAVIRNLERLFSSTKTNENKPLLPILSEALHEGVKATPESFKQANNIEPFSRATQTYLDTFFAIAERRARAVGGTGLESELIGFREAALREDGLRLLPGFDQVAPNGTKGFDTLSKVDDQTSLSKIYVKSLGELHRRYVKGQKSGMSEGSFLAPTGPLSKVYRDVIFKRILRYALDNGFDGISLQPSWAASATSYGPWLGVNAHWSQVLKNAQRYTQKTWGRDPNDPIVWTYGRFNDTANVARNMEKGPNVTNYTRTRPGQYRTDVPEETWMASVLKGDFFSQQTSISREHRLRFSDYILENMARSVDDDTMRRITAIRDRYKDSVPPNDTEMLVIRSELDGMREQGAFGRILREGTEFESDGDDFLRALQALITRPYETRFYYNANAPGSGTPAVRVMSTTESIPVMLFNRSIKESSRRQRLMQLSSTNEIKGATEFLDDGRAIITAFESADISTIIHEMGHVIRRTLDRDQNLILRRWIADTLDIPIERTLDPRTGDWTVQAEEAFARGFERMFSPKSKAGQTFDIDSMDAATADVFRKVRTFMNKVYKETEKRKQLGKPLSQRAKTVLDELLGVRERIDIQDIYGPGRRISPSLFVNKVQSVLNQSLGSSTPHAQAKMFLEDLSGILGGTESELIRKLSNPSSYDIVIDGRDLQTLYDMLDEMPEFIKRYHLMKEGLAPGEQMLSVLGNPFLKKIRKGHANAFKEMIQDVNQHINFTPSRIGYMKDEIVELTKANANMNRQFTDEINIVLRQNRTKESFVKALLDYVDGQATIRTPNGFTVFNQGPLSIYRHLQKHVEDHPFFDVQRREPFEKYLKDMEKKQGRSFDASERKALEDAYNRNASNVADMTSKTDVVRALATVFVKNTERYPIGAEQAADLEEVAYHLLTGKQNTGITFRSLRGKDDKPIFIRMGVSTGTTHTGSTIFLKPADTMKSFIEQMKRAHKVITDYEFRIKGSEYDELNPLAGEASATKPLHEALRHAVQIAGQTKVYNETIRDYRKIFGLITETEAMNINRMIEDPNAAIETLDEIGTRYLALQRTTGPKRTTMLEKHGNMVDLSRRMVSVAKTPTGAQVFMPYDLVRRFDSELRSLVNDLDTITPEQGFVTKLGERGASMAVRGYRGYLDWWRQSVLTGLLMPNPRYWVNNIVGDLSQMITSIGVGPASRLSFQNLFSNLEVGSFRVLGKGPRVGPFKPHEYLLKKSEELQGKPVLGTIMNALFNPRLNNVWSGKNGFMILPDGRQLPYAQLRDWLVKDGILDSFTQAELATQMAKVMKNQGWFAKKADWLREWQFDIQSHATMVQQRQRTALYLDLLERGYSRKEAKNLTLEALYDWRNSLGQAEMNTSLLLFVPFWRFHKLAWKQMSVAFFEAYTMPGKDYWKKLATGRTKWTRLRGQAQLAQGIPSIVGPTDEEAFLSDTAELDLLARIFTPPWAGRLHSWNVPGALNQDEWNWMRDNLGHAQSFNRAGYRIWYGPQLTATHQLQIFNSFFAMFTAGTAAAAGLKKHGDLGHYLTDGWERQIFEPWMGMMHRPMQAFTGQMLEGLGFNVGFVPGRYLPNQGKLTAAEKSLFDFFDRISGGNSMWATGTQDERGRYNANPILLKLWKETPFFGLQLMGVIDKSQRALNFASAKFPEDSWLEFLYGFAYFTGAWTGIAKPYEFAVDRNFDQWIRDIRKQIGVEEIPLDNFWTDYDFKYNNYK